MIKAGIDLTRSLVKSLSKNKLPKSYLKLFINEGTIRFCLFMGTLTFLKKCKKLNYNSDSVYAKTLLQKGYKIHGFCKWIHFWYFVTNDNE